MFGNHSLRGSLKRLAILTLALAAWATAGADPVKITFLPPPLEGTLSLGVYDATGTLVRVLRREAAWSEFTAGDDGFRIEWDGKDDKGAFCPSGTYRIRGVAVGDLGVEGVDFTGNDWVSTDDAPHIRRIAGLSTNAEGALVIAATLPGQSDAARYAVAVKPAKPGEDPETELTPQAGLPETPGKPEAAPKQAEGANHTTWGIVGVDVVQLSQKGNAVRRLTSPADEPPPVKVAASPKNEKLFVLYEDEDLQRVRGYDFAGVKPGGAPKLLFENDIVFSDRYEQVAAELTFSDGKPFASSPVLSVALQPNPLAGNKPGTLLVRALVDKDGAWLATADGLPLARVADTKAVAWAVLGRPAGSKAITFFDSDGAVVEQFRIGKSSNMMAFDAGAVAWTAPAVSPTPTPAPSAAPEASATPAPSVSPSATPALTP